MIRLPSFVLIASLLVVGCAIAQPAPEPAVHQTVAARGAAAGPPTLVVFIAVDQLRADYLTRFGPQLTGGLRRILDHGAVFLNAFHDHAVTETAPGHSTMMSGRFPVHTGITSNSQGVNSNDWPLLEGAPGPGAAPYRFEGTTLTDWLVRKDRRTKALSISRKDRGAILPIGKSKQAVFWYSTNGTFTTSTWYADALPAWVRAFNAERMPQASAGRAWTLLLPEGDYPEPDSVAVEGSGRDFVFPHLSSPDGTRAAAALGAFPWMDDLTLQFALRGMQAMQLGLGPQADVLNISLSTTDAVGHRFGPDSREVHDQILRVDRYLGEFLDSLFKLRDSTRIVIALTGDHGVTPFPGVRSADPNQGARVVSLDTIVQTMAKGLIAARVEPGRVASYEDGVLAVDRQKLQGTRVDPDSLVDWFAAAARKVPGVYRADRMHDLAKADTVKDAIARRWLHMFPADGTVVLVVTLQRWSVWLGTIAMHGSPWDQDANVPVLFWGAPFKAGRYADTVRVVDMAPTLAEVLGTRPTERVDGRVLRQALP